MIGLFQRKDAKAQRRKGWPTQPSWSAGFTVKELAIVVVLVAVLVMVAVLQLPPVYKAKKKAYRINCVSNLKQIHTAFRLWAIDFGGTNELYSTQISTNAGGARELLARGEVWPVFQVMSNELKTPKLLICPSDIREVALSFDRLHITNLSYFVSRDAGEEFPESVLAGDRNLEIAGKQVLPGQLTLTSNRTIGWSTNQHNVSGNVVLADGSAQQLSNARFQELLLQQQPATNRIVIP